MTAFVPDSPLALEVVASPNHGARRRGERPDMLILHYTGMTDAAAAIAWLCAAASGVSAHYVVREDGSIVQCVPEAQRAWHAGVAWWDGIADINSHSIGIEIVNPGHDGGYPDFPDAQIEAVIALCRDILGRHPIAPQRVLAHSDVAPARKQDPGEKFPWPRLAAAGIGHWVEPAALGAGPAAAVDNLMTVQAALRAYGYRIEPTGAEDAATATVVTAFQRHFRPARVDGVADASTRATLQKLLAALPTPPKV
jgi:N-acetylmuramoyl-L-alanine amidase